MSTFAATFSLFDDGFTVEKWKKYLEGRSDEDKAGIYSQLGQNDKAIIDQAYRDQQIQGFM